MNALKTILMTTDLSPNADAAIPYAAALAKVNGATLHLFHVLEDDSTEAFAEGIVIGVSAWIAAMRKRHKDRVAAMAERIEKEYGVSTIYAVASGNPAQETARYAKRFNADVVVTATHGRTGLTHLILGSVAEKIVRLCPAPVLTVRPGEKQPGPDFKFATILLATDFSENANVAEAHAVSLARQSGATIVLAHVVEDSVYYSSAAASEGIGVDVEQWLATVCEESRKRLRAEAVALAQKSDINVVPVLTRGYAAEQLVAIAKEHHAELIAISTHGYTGLSHLLFGSIAEKVVRISPVPVLTVKPRKVVETIGAAV